MSLPVTIVSAGQGPGRNPPHKSEAGAFYFIAKNGTTLEAHKSSNPGTVSPAEQDSGNHPTVDGTLVMSSATGDADDLIHIVTLGSTSFLLEYHRFNMATDTWAVTSNTIADLSGASSPSTDVLWCDIEYRDVLDDELVITCSDLKVSGVDRVKWYRGKSTGTPSWTGPNSFGEIGGSWYSRQAYMFRGSSNGIHVMWSQSLSSTANESVRTQTIRSNNTLSSTDSGSQDTAGALLGLIKGVSWGTDSSRNILAPYHSGGAGAALTIQTNEVSGDFNNWTTTRLITDSDVYVNGESSIAAMVEEEGTVYFLYSDASTQDLFLTSSVNDGTDWETPAEEMDGVTVNYLSVGVYDHGPNRVIGFLYDDAGALKYNEVAIGVISLGPKGRIFIAT